MSDTSLSALLGSADLGDSATAAMNLTADTLGPAIAAGLGTVQLDDITSSELLLYTSLLDDSSSIRFVKGNVEAVRDGQNGTLDALAGAKQAGDVLISCRYLNDGNGAAPHGVLYPYRPLSGAIRLDTSNYNPSGGTPLYDQAAVTLTGVAAKVAEFEQGGIAVRAVTLIVTDGADAGSYRHTSGSVRQIVEGLLKTEQHIIAGMGIDDGTTDFRKIFNEMGIPAEWILTPSNNDHEIRQAFAVVSQSAVRASQAVGASFSQVALGGFGTTP